MPSSVRGEVISPGAQGALRAKGHPIGRNRLARLMREEGLHGRRRRRFRLTTDSNHHQPVAPNTLDRQFQVETPNRA
jgi:transposase InsO family protein